MRQRLAIIAILCSLASASVFVPGVLAASPDFSLSWFLVYSPTKIQQGSPLRTPVNVTSLNSFSGNVALSVTVTPSVNGPSVSISPSPLTINPGGTNQALLVVDFTGTPLGNYNVTVTGTSGPIQHSLSVILELVQKPTSPPAGTSLLSYKLGYAGVPHPGAQLTFVNTFTKLTDVTVLVTGLEIRTGFGVFSPTAGLPLNMTGIGPGEATLNLTISIPANIAYAIYAVNATVEWEYVDPATYQFATGNPIVVNGSVFVGPDWLRILEGAFPRLSEQALLEVFTAMLIVPPSVTALSVFFVARHERRKQEVLRQGKKH